MTEARYRTIAVLMGGSSAERDVSLKSGAAVANGLREAGYEVIEVDLQGRDLDLPAETDAVFIALHGEFGEDGGVQAILDQRGIPYTGSGAEASRIAFDKILTKELLVKSGIPTPLYEVLRGEAPRTLALPVVIKPACQGSSIGIHRVRQESDWEAARTDALIYGPDVIVEAYIKGRELTVGVVGDEALPVVEIVAPDDWYDYRAKYTKGESRYLAPAPLTDAEATACRTWALQTFKAMGCRGFGRVDFRLSEQGEPTVLEMNSIPGFTETSLLPMAAAESGLSFSELCDRIVRVIE